MTTIQRLDLGALLLALVLFSGLGTPAQEVGKTRPDPAPGTVTKPAASVDTTPSNSESATPKEVLPAQFQANVYEVRAIADRAGTLDAKALARQATTPEALLKVLGEVGHARILYRIDQPVDVCSARITISTTEPVVTATRTDFRGREINMTRSQQVGVTVRLSAKAPAKGANDPVPNVAVSFELAALVSSDIEIAPGRKATGVRTVASEHNEPLEYERPQVMVAVSSASEAEQTNPRVYVFRYLFSRPAGK